MMKTRASSFIRTGLLLLLLYGAPVVFTTQASAASKCSAIGITISSDSAAVGDTISFSKAPPIGITKVRFDGANDVADLKALTISDNEQITVAVPPIADKLETIVDLFNGNALVCTEKLALLPIVASVSPVTTKIGYEVTIKGSYFDMTSLANNKVTINDVPVDAPITKVSATELKVKVPIASSGMIQVKTSAGKSNASVPLTITTPVITGISKNQALIGDTIEIEGKNFDNTSIVSINKTDAPVTFVNSTKLKVIVPLTTSGPIKVTQGGEEAVYKEDFKVITQLTFKSTDENKLSPGMKRKLMAHTPGFYPKDGKQTQYFAPAKSELRVVSDEDKDGNIIVVITCVGKSGKDVKVPFELEAVSKDTAYVISANKLSAEFPSKGYGFTSGVMTVPYKYYPNKQELSGQPTVSGYLGWKFGDTLSLGYELSFIGSAGLGVVPITTTDSSGAKSAGSGASFAAAWGFIMTVNKHFQVGIVQGWDWTNKSVGYDYQGKPWIAVSLGTAIY